MVRRSQRPAPKRALLAGGPWLLPLWICALAAVTGCAEPAAPTAAGAPSPPAAQVAVTDGLGRRVALAAPATRIVSLSPALTEMLYAVGCGDRLVLRDTWSDYPAAAASVPAIDALRPAAEPVIEARPDLLLLSFPGPALRAAAEASGAAWVALSPTRLEQVVEDLRTVGRLCGRQHAGEAAAAQVRAALAPAGGPGAHAAPTPRRPRVYLELDVAGERAWTAGDDTFTADVIRHAGGDNALSGLRGWPQIGIEAVIAADPDVILLAWPGAPGDLSDAEARATFGHRAGATSLRAFRQGRVHRVDAATLGRPGPRVVEALARVRSLLATATGAPP